MNYYNKRERIFNLINRLSKTEKIDMIKDINKEFNNTICLNCDNLIMEGYCEECYDIQIEELENEISELKEEIYKLDNENDELEEQIDKLNDENDELTDKIEELGKNE